jgi:hypothetical protein
VLASRRDVRDEVRQVRREKGSLANRIV